MRRDPTEPELRLWRNLSGSRLGGYKFRRQATIEPFIVDFLWPAKGLVVEVDGDTHQAEKDAWRDAALNLRGFTTIRFTNDDVMTNMEGVLTVILQKLESLPDRWSGSPDSPTPIPSPEGEGLQG
jgi:very-short-patch-repair endonuclease